MENAQIDYLGHLIKKEKETLIPGTEVPGIYVY